MIYDHKQALWAQMPYLADANATSVVEAASLGLVIINGQIIADCGKTSGISFSNNKLNITEDVELNITQIGVNEHASQLEIIVEPCVSCRIIEHVVCANAKQQLEVNWQISADASVEHAVHSHGAQGQTMLCYNVNLATNSHYKAWRIAHSAAWLHEHTVCALNADFAKAELNSLVLALPHNNCQTSGTFKHIAPNTSSKHKVTMLVGAAARAVCYSDVEVLANASNSSAKQYNNNLALADTAEMFTQPRLCINNDQVNCSHGATTGKLDPQMLHYMCARGIQENKARQLLTLGYALELLQDAPPGDWAQVALDKMGELSVK